MPKNNRTSKFRLLSAAISAVCLILAGSVIAPISAIGHTQYFWWTLLLIAFFIPYSLISSELSMQYPSEGGIYTWIKKAFGSKWAGRAIWLYWLSFPIWIATLANLATLYLLQILGVTVTWPIILALQVGYIIIVSLLSLTRISQSAYFASIDSVVKVFFMLGLGVLGVYAFITHGTVNAASSWTDFLPAISTSGHFSIAGIGLVAVIIFSMIGFEIVPAVKGDLSHPQKQIPRLVLLSALFLTTIYLLASFGVGVTLPFGQISLSTGALDAYQTLTTSLGISSAAAHAFITIAGGLFIYSLIANVASWSFGVNSVAASAAKDGVFPKSWSKLSKTGTPYVATLWSSFLALIITGAGIAVTQLTSVTDIFWPLFMLSLALLLLAYLPVFFAFIKLHKDEPIVKKAYWIRGGRIKIFLLGFVPALAIILSLFFMLVPEFSVTVFHQTWFTFVGVSFAIIVGELIVFRLKPAQQLSSKASASKTSPRKTKTTRTTKTPR